MCAGNDLPVADGGMRHHAEWDGSGSAKLPTRVALVGGRPLLHEGLRLILTDHGITVAGSYPDQDDLPKAVDCSRRGECDVVMVVLADAGPFSVFHRIRSLVGESAHAVPLVVLSDRASRGMVNAALRIGVKGYVDLGASTEELIASVLLAADGEVYLSSLAAEFLASDSGVVPRAPRAVRLPNVALSPREMEIVHLLCEGHVSREIARQLHISAKTVENHRYNIYRKCEVDNIAGLVRRAIQEGMV